MMLPPWPRLVFGPYIMKKFGKPGTVMPEVAPAASSVPHTSCSSAPSRPRDLDRRTGCGAPRNRSRARSRRTRARRRRVVTIAPARRDAMSSVTSSTSSRRSAAYQPLSMQHPLAERRIVGQRLGDAGPAGRRARSRCTGEEAAVAVVDRVDRALRVSPLGIDLQRRVDPVVEHPQQPEPVPRVVVGHVSISHCRRRRPRRSSLGWAPPTAGSAGRPSGADLARRSPGTICIALGPGADDGDALPVSSTPWCQRAGVDHAGRAKASRPGDGRAASAG